MTRTETDPAEPFARAAQELLTALGPKAVSEDPTELAPLLTDWRGRWTGHSPLLLKPASTEEMSTALAICARHGLAVTPQGGNSGMVHGSTPHGEVLVSTRRMNRVREVDRLNGSMTLEAGVVLTTAQEEAERAGCLFPLSLGAEGVATIGGLVSTNAGGVAVLRYGMMRDLVLGLEVVLADGQVWRGLRGLRKDNTGYDLKQLFIGAEGTLGVVTAATLKLFPRPVRREVAWAVCRTPAEAVELLARVRAMTGDAVTGFELIPARALELVLQHVPGMRDPLPSPHGWRVLVELSLFSDAGARDLIEDALASAMEGGLVADVVIADNDAQGQLLWKIRENVPVAERRQGKALKHDVSVPVSSLPAFLDQAEALVLRLAPGAEVVAFGHVGDGNMHFNVLPPPGVDTDAWLEGPGADLTADIHDLVTAFNGSISAEHGIGLLKAAEMARRKTPLDIDLMARVKRALDPDNRMNPGRVIAV